MNSPELSQLKHLSMEHRGQVADNEITETYFSYIVTGRQAAMQEFATY